MPTTEQLHILIAENEGCLLSSLQFLFHRKGYQVTKAKTGTLALHAACKSYREGAPIDLLITDIQMPGMDGEKLIRAIRKFNTRMPILVMTGFGYKELVVRLMRLGCSDYIDKPFTLNQIEDRVELLLSKTFNTMYHKEFSEAD